MSKQYRIAVIVAGLVFILRGASSWGQVPAGNDTSNGSNNTGGGTGALKSPLLSGTNNTAYGSSALATNTSGSSNTASGFQALQSNTSGSSNTAVGNIALNSNTAGV